MTRPTDPLERGFSLRVDAEQAPEAGPVERPAARRVREVREPPFCIAVLGDFSGRGGRRPTGGSPPPWTPRRATPDNVPGLAGLEARLELRMPDGPASPLHLRFETLSDFHPDALFRELPLFETLRRARAAAEEGRESGFPLEAEAERGGSSGAGGSGGEAGPGGEEAVRPPGSEEAEGSTPAPGGAGGGLLDAILEESRSRDASDGSSRPAPERDAEKAGRLDAELREFVREIVDPHRVRPGPDRSAEIAAIDRAASALMRRILSHERFRSLESRWRSLVFLLSRIDTGPKVRVYLVDVARKELEEDLADAEDVTGSRLHGLLSAPRLGFPGGRWAAVVGAYTFGADPREAPLLARIARVACSADVPWLSAAHPRLVGCESPADTPDPADWSEPWDGPWSGLPRAPEARWVGLALPRFLPREPYGPESGRRCRAFDFAEEPREGPGEAGGSTGSRSLPWGNPAFVCAALLARSFSREGWGFSPNAGLELGQVPVAPGRGASDPEVVVTDQPLSPGAASRVAEAGLMPLVAFSGQACLRLGGFRSIAEPRAELRGWWVR